MVDQILPAIVAAIISGALSSIATVAALRVHIEYLKESVDKAHARIDNITRG